MTTITSRPYNPAMACEACVFGRFEHASWCSTNEPFSYSFVLKSGKIVEGDELRSLLYGKMVTDMMDYAFHHDKLPLYD